MAIEELKIELQGLDKDTFGYAFAKASAEASDPLAADDTMTRLETEYPALFFMGVVVEALVVRGELSEEEALLLNQGLLTTCVALTSAAASEGLKRELKQLDRRKLGGAFAIMLRKQEDATEAVALLDNFEAEYPALSFAALVMQACAQESGARESQADTLITGTLVAGLALKQLIDQNELEKIPIQE